MKIHCIVLSSAALVSATLAAAEAPTRTETELAPGFTLVERVDAAKPFRVKMIRIDLAQKNLRFDVRNGGDTLLTRQRVSESAAELAKENPGLAPMAALNTDFFDNNGKDAADGGIAGRTARMNVAHGVLMQTGYEHEPGFSPSLYETTDGRIRVGKIGFRGETALGEKKFPIDFVNTVPAYIPADVAKQPARVGVYTPAWVGAVPYDGVLVKFARPFADGGSAAVKDKKFKVVRPIKKGEKLPDDDPLAGAVVGLGTTAAEVAAATGTGSVSWSFTGAEGEIRNLVGIWVEPMTFGVVKDTHEVDNYPRSAFGLSVKKNLFVLCAVDGRQPGWSTSIPSRRMAELLQEEGCDYAGQFDGGGSTTLWSSKGGVLNKPSDGAERRVASSIIFSTVNPQKAEVAATAKKLAGPKPPKKKLPPKGPEFKAKFTSSSLKFSRTTVAKDRDEYSVKGYVKADFNSTTNRFKRPILHIVTLFEYEGLWKYYDLIQTDQRVYHGSNPAADAGPERQSRWQPEIAKEAWTHLQYGAPEHGFFYNSNIPPKAKLLVYRLEIWQDGKLVTALDTPKNAVKKFGIPENWYEKGKNAGRITYHWPPPPEPKKK